MTIKAAPTLHNLFINNLRPRNLGVWGGTLLLICVAPFTGYCVEPPAFLPEMTYSFEPNDSAGFDERLAQQAYDEAMRSAQTDQRTYYILMSDPQQIADRFSAILPNSVRNEVHCKVDAQARTVTVVGPPQILATADQLIPRMDANTQLNDGTIDYGLAAAPAVSQGELREPYTQPVASEPYYDPNENRMVRTLSEPEHAILPPSHGEPGMALLGSSDSPADSAREDTPDVAIFNCSSRTIAVVVARAKREFADDSEITITSDPQAGKIIAYTTRKKLDAVRNYLLSLGASLVNPGADSHQERTNSAPFTARSNTPISNAYHTASSANSSASRNMPEAQRQYKAVYKNISVLETELANLMQERLIRIAPVNINDPSLTPAQKENTVWQFTHKENDDLCSLSFTPREQKITISGSNRLVDQMYTLLESLDNSGRSGASRPHYIRLKNADPAQIQEIFHIQKNHPRVTENNLEDPSAALAAETRVSNDPIRPVNWQEETGSSGSGISSGDTTGVGEINLVPDYIPLVLPDLDMVILDAPEAESKRIIEMIEKIEELAAEAQPQTEIYYLHHVNSVMLSGVLSKLYAEMFATKQGRVLVYALQSPNAVLLVGWGEAPKAMKALIETFDQPIEAHGSMIRVIGLQYASAQEVSRMLNEYFPSTQPESAGMAPRIRVIPDPRTNSIIIHAAQNDFEEIQKILVDLDTNKSESKLLVKPFKLKYSLVEDIRKSIQQAILPATSGTLPASESKYPILQIMSVDAESKKLIESGIMRDIQLSSDIANNQLIVTAPSDCMDLIETLINMLDASPATGQIKLFPLRYADATQVQKTLSQLLPTGGGSMPSIPNAEGEQSFVPVRFAIDSRTNCILAAASPLDLKIIDSLIIVLDRKDTSERKEEVIQLRNVKASAISDAVNKYLSEKQRLELSSGSISDYQLFDSQVIVVPEGNTNSVIISATPKYLEEVSALIKSFDSEPAEVNIQVLIAEVALTDDEEFGFEAGLQDSIAFDRSIVTSVTNGVNSATGSPGYNIISSNNKGANYLATADPSTLAGTAISTLGMGRTSSDLGYGGLVLSASSNSVELVLRALREKNRIQILSRPQVQAMDNQQAFILIGQRVPRISGATTSSYSVTSNVTEANVGLILLVTPRISKDGRVIMEIGAEKSSLGSDSDAIPVYTSGDQVIKSPTIDTTQVMTAVSAVDGETVMLGGLISNTKVKTSHGVPYLSDIPVVGWLFRFDKNSEERKELIIVMTPRVIRGRSDSEKIKRIEASKMSWCLADAMSINGNMGLYDPLAQRQNPSAQTTNLPILQMDDMEQVPPSKRYPYNPQKDYQNGSEVLPSDAVPRGTRSSAPPATDRH